MNFMQQVQEWLGLTRPAQPEVQAIRDGVEAGRRAKLAEDYDRALETFDRVLQAAKTMGDSTAATVIGLHQADILVRQRRWDEARERLAALRQTAHATAQKTQLSYTLSVLGTLAQAQGDWLTARQQYEQALEQGKSAGAVGAQGRAQGHLADTYLHEGNASYAAHLLREALPRLNMSGDIELSSYFVGLLGQSLIGSGQEVEGQQLIERALQLAGQLHDRYYQRHWALELGERALREARFQDALSLYGQALRLFAAGSESPEYLKALCQISKACLSLRQFDEAVEYAKQAETIARRLNDETTIASVQGVLGMALRGSGRSPEAIGYLQAAADAAGDEVSLDILRHLASTQADAGVMDTAVATYQRAAQLAEARGSNLELAQCRRDLGLIYQRQGQMQSAIQEWTAAMPIYEVSKSHAQIARLYCDLAVARKYLGQGQRAIKDYEQALMALNAVDQGDVETRGLVLSNAANAYADQGDVESADSFFNEAISLAERSSDRAAEATRRGNYGWFLLSVGRPRRAIAALEQALNQSKVLDLELQTAVQTDNLGLAYDSLADYPVALGHHRRALEQVRKLSNPLWEAAFKINLANTLVAMGEVHEAETLCREGLAEARREDYLELTIRALTASARVALRRGQNQDAGTMLDEAINLSRRADMRRLLAEALSVRSEQEAALNMLSEATATWDEAQRLFSILHTPQSRFQPAWVNKPPVK